MEVARLVVGEVVLFPQALVGKLLLLPRGSVPSSSFEEEAELINDLHDIIRN